ncbi:MAG: hypothetical protein JSW61_07435 [Candidatus Thorarchaeota archaeon]|nr:MAG: hypothetical protein JSW61_07435 [Candidatus Thorarchaeota archaeon]
MSDEYNERVLALYAITVAIAYGAAGVLQILSGVGLVQISYVGSDMIAGLMVLVVALVFSAGVKPLLASNREGIAFFVVGSVLASILFILQVLIVGTNLIGWVLRFEDWLSWSVLNDLTPSIWLYPIASIALVGERTGKLTITSLGPDSSEVTE